jgi:VWFA-related protein
MFFGRRKQVMMALPGLVAMLFPLATLLAAQQVQAKDGLQEQSNQNEAGSIPVIRSTTTLVYLDVTVLDKKGHPVVKGLTKDDFSITEDKKPERIFSFEEPEVHLGKGEDGKVPQTVLVLDLLNTSYPSFAYVRDQATRFLLNQPDELRSATEIMVVGNQTLELLQGFTRSRKDLLFALDHLPRALPYKQMNFSWDSDRIRQSYIALQQIAAQNRGVPGRKNVMWIGSGSPNLFASNVPDPVYDKVQLYVHRTVNMMVEARISLFLIYPGLRQGDTNALKRASDLISDGDSADPFADSNFTEFVYETGGKVFDLNDVSREIDDSIELGSKYYTLTYQPQADKADGAFRRIQVKLRNPDLHVMTKAGYFSREPKEAVESDDMTVNMLTEAALAVIPMKALQVRVASVLRHPDAHTAEITVELADGKLGWESGADGMSDTTVIVTAVSKSGRGDVLASKVAKYALHAKSQDADKLAKVKPTVKFTLRLPRSTKDVRVAVATSDGGRIGSVDLTRKEIDTAPEGPTSDPPLLASPVRSPVHSPMELKAKEN